MFSFRGQKTCCCGDYARRLEHAGSPRVRGYTNILENACHCEKVLLITESDPQGIQIDIRFCNSVRSECISQQNHVRPLVRTNLSGDVPAEDFVIIEGHSRSACRITTRCRILTSCLTVNTDTKVGDRFSLHRKGIEL